MKKPLVLVLLSLLLPLASSQPAFAGGKVYTIHNKLQWPIVVTFTAQCRPYSFKHTIGAHATGTFDTACGSAGMDVVTTPLGHAHCWNNLRFVFQMKFNVMPTNFGTQGCIINTIAPGL